MLMLSVMAHITLRDLGLLAQVIEVDIFQTAKMLIKHGANIMQNF